MTMLKTIHFYGFNEAMATNKSDLKKLTVVDSQEASKFHYSIFGPKGGAAAGFEPPTLK